jgi:mannose-1-phosphate guanylyltransferase
MLHALIMAGGGGTRFWPRSRQKRPKQFLPLAGERTLLQQAFDRIEALTTRERVWIITSSSQADLVAEQLPEVPRQHIIAEPCGRDTAACIGIGAALIAASDPAAVMVAMPADHIIEPEATFRKTIQAAEQLAGEFADALITFGVAPTFPATGYGYIHRGAEIAGRLGTTVYRIEAFKEKPDANTAERYLTSGQFYWNSGIFVWRASTILKEFRNRQPQLHDAARQIADAWPTKNRSVVFQKVYEPLAKMSIDYAIMEGCASGLVLHATFTWDDVGSWQAIERRNPQDAEGNTILGKHCGLATKNCLIAGDSNHLIATAGVENLVIVQDGDATLIADKRDEAAIKKLVEHLKKSGWDKYL